MLNDYVLITCQISIHFYCTSSVERVTLMQSFSIMLHQCKKLNGLIK